MSTLQDQCATLNNAELMRLASPLYPSFALESLSGIILCIYFSSVALKLHAGSGVRSPLKAVWRLVRLHALESFLVFKDTMMTLPQMPTLKLRARFRFCKNVDISVAIFSAVCSILGLTRWLSIGNVNGLRYLGYWCTCPLMMVELVSLIAPVVPLFLLTSAFVGFVTFVTLVTGYAASVMDGAVIEGNIWTFLTSMDTDDLGRATNKFWTVCPAFVGITALTCLALPYLALVYACGRRGKHRDDLPSGFVTLLAIVFFTWWLFPIWWMFSWEGQAIIVDTKINELGFTFLNILAKGLFVLQNFRMMTAFEAKRKEIEGDSFEEDSLALPDVLSRRRSLQLRESKFNKALKEFDDAIAEQMEILMSPDRSPPASPGTMSPRGTSQHGTPSPGMSQQLPFSMGLKSQAQGEQEVPEYTTDVPARDRGGRRSLKEQDVGMVALMQAIQDMKREMQSLKKEMKTQNTRENDEPKVSFEDMRVSFKENFAEVPADATTPWQSKRDDELPPWQSPQTPSVAGQPRTPTAGTATEEDELRAGEECEVPPVHRIVTQLHALPPTRGIRGENPLSGCCYNQCVGA